MHRRTESGLSKPQRISAVCAAACGLLAAAIPLFVIGSWAVGSPEHLADSFRVPTPRSGLFEPWQRATGALINLPSAALLAFALWRARGCLSVFSRGGFFEPEAIRRLRDFACASFFAVLIGFFEETATAVIATWTNGPGLRELTFGIGSQQVFQALYAGIFWVVSAAMARAILLARENEQFV